MGECPTCYAPAHPCKSVRDGSRLVQNHAPARRAWMEDLAHCGGSETGTHRLSFTVRCWDCGGARHLSDAEKAVVLQALANLDARGPA